MICVLLGLVSCFHGNELAPRAQPAAADATFTMVVSSRYSAWWLLSSDTQRGVAPATLWIPAYAGMTVRVCGYYLMPVRRSGVPAAWIPVYAGMRLGFGELCYLGLSMSTVTPMSMYLLRSAGSYDR